MSYTDCSDSAITIGLIQQLLDQHSAKPISTSSEEVSGVLLVEAAASVSLAIGTPQASNKIVHTEPGPPPPDMEASTAVEGNEISSENSAPRVADTDGEETEPKPLKRFDMTDTTPVETEDGIALVLAAANGDLEMTELLLEFDIDPNSIGPLHGSALQAAACSGHIEIVKCLMAKGAYMIWTGLGWGSLLSAAIKSGHVEIVKILLEATADPNCGEVLAQAAAKGLVKVVKYLLNYGANADTCGGLLGSPLQEAAFCGHVETVEVFLAAGADANTSGPRWGSPMQAAVRGRHKDIARVLMEHKRRVQ